MRGVRRRPGSWNVIDICRCAANLKHDLDSLVVHVGVVLPQAREASSPCIDIVWRCPKSNWCHPRAKYGCCPNVRQGRRSRPPHYVLSPMAVRARPYKRVPKWLHDHCSWILASSLCVLAPRFGSCLRMVKPVLNLPPTIHGRYRQGQIEMENSSGDYYDRCSQNYATANKACHWHLTMRLSDAGLRQRQTKALYPNHRPHSLAQRRRAPRSLEPIVRHLRLGPSQRPW